MGRTRGRDGEEMRIQNFGGKAPWKRQLGKWRKMWG